MSGFKKLTTKPSSDFISDSSLSRPRPQAPFEAHDQLTQIVDKLIRKPAQKSQLKRQAKIAITPQPKQTAAPQPPVTFRWRASSKRSSTNIHPKPNVPK